MAHPDDVEVQVKENLKLCRFELQDNFYLPFFSECNHLRPEKAEHSSENDFWFYLLLVELHWYKEVLTCLLDYTLN